MSQLRYATVRKYALRELNSRKCNYAIIGAKIAHDDNQVSVTLASTPDKIIYFNDNKAYLEYINNLLSSYPQVITILTVQR